MLLKLFSGVLCTLQNVDLNRELRARTEHGVLTLELPKVAEPSPPPIKEIPVEGH